MATYPDGGNFDLEEQRVRILRAIEEVEKFAVESRKLGAEQLKLTAEQAKLELGARISPLVLLAQGALAAAALMGAGAALAKLFIS